MGSGPDEQAVRDRVAGLGSAAERVDFVPPVTDAMSQLRSSSILALPSLTEGLPLVLAEGMAMGLPCVATDCSAGVRLLSDDGAAARVVPRADAGALADALDALMSSPEDRARLGAVAREAVSPYRAELIIDRWEAMIAAVLR